MTHWVNLVRAAQTGNWEGVDLKKISPKMLRDFSYEGKSLLEITIRAGKVETFPKELITKELLLAPSTKKDTMLHLAAQLNQLHNIPKKYLKKEYLELGNVERNTVIHYAAMRGCLKDIPKEHLTDENISQRNTKGDNSLDYAFYSWDPEKKKGVNSSIKDGIDLMISKLSDTNLKAYLKKVNVDIEELKKMGSRYKAGPNQPPLEEKHLIMKTLISKELIKRALAKKENSIEI